MDLLTHKECSVWNCQRGDALRVGGSRGLGKWQMYDSRYKTTMGSENRCNFKRNSMLTYCQIIHLPIVKSFTYPQSNHSFTYCQIIHLPIVKSMCFHCEMNEEHVLTETPLFLKVQTHVTLSFFFFPPFFFFFFWQEITKEFMSVFRAMQAKPLE